MTHPCLSLPAKAPFRPRCFGGLMLAALSRNMVLKENQRPSSILHRGPWKLMAWYETGAVKLFTLDEEISEATDVAAPYPLQYAELRVRPRDYRKSVDAQMPTLDWKSFGLDAASEDVDQDGLPDEWEFRELFTWAYGPDNDPDGDGRSNLEKLKAGTDPFLPD